MSFVVKIDRDYIAEGQNYTVQGSSYVPITGRIEEAKRYKTYSMAERGANRSGENMHGTIEIIELKEG